MPGKLIDPRVRIPSLIQQGDTVAWVDDPFADIEGGTYDSTGFTLTYTVIGPAKLTAAAAALGSGWETTISAAQSASLTAGQYFWQARIAGAVSITVARGELKVITDLSQQGAGYSGLSQAEQTLATWESALAALTGAQGSPVESYKVGEREMRYRNVPEILQTIAYWRAKVISERTADSISQGQGNPRKLYFRWPSRFGSGT